MYWTRDFKRWVGICRGGTDWKWEIGWALCSKRNTFRSNYSWLWEVDSVFARLVCFACFGISLFCCSFFNFLFLVIIHVFSPTAIAYWDGDSVFVSYTYFIFGSALLYTSPVLTVFFFLERIPPLLFFIYL